ncbi:LTA synthase family protein [Shewanella glacialimarina]|uniref:LTA synthase family protein n=1 Tax=Shewanella glacialimarina TaxID=2590884 RepID=UPI001CF8F89E|nr:LTA synthase family protein [Shewanella glacialimarina]UCX03233.1 LTA synthase family protein [Shewanella glacialimarina]
MGLFSLKSNVDYIRSSRYPKPHNIYSAILVFALIILAVTTLSRIGLSLWQLERVNDAQGWSDIIFQGIRVDFATLCWLFGIAALGTALFAGNHAIGRLWALILKVWLTLGLWLIVFLEISTPSFIQEYGFRPNRLYVEYLIYPKEVLSMLWAGRKAELIFAFVVSTATLYAGWRLSDYFTRNVRTPRWYWRPVMAILVICVTILGARSSLGHRPLNPSLVAFSDDPLVNSLVLNSGYSLTFAIKQMSNEEEASKVYGKLDDQKVIDIIRRQSGRSAQAFTSTDLPSLTFNQATYQGKPKNLVIILQESLGARFVGSLGGLPLTPNIDELSSQGWFFENLYATGTRSVRGIEAITTGFTPTPARAVVKLGKSQTNFFTIAELLKRNGYSTQFIYGGESHFDNMRSFFLGNGFSQIIDQNDYKNPAFVASWGVSDEDLLFRAHDEFTAMHEQGKPFFSLVFSSSNHDPYEFPDNRIELYEQPQYTMHNAVKYADYAVGEFFKKAQKADYWKDTLFLVVADHDSRVGGANLVPISRFRIPGLILGGGIEAMRDPRVVSQIDMAPTLLSMMGISDSYPMLGRDLTQQAADWPGRAMMQYDKNFALMEGNQVTILQPEQAAKSFVYDFGAETLTSRELDTEQAENALGIALWGSAAYNNHWFTLPKQTQTEQQSR